MVVEKYYSMHNVERMKSLEGVELASFKRRAASFSIDIAVAFVIFLAVPAVIGLIVFFIERRTVEITHFTMRFGGKLWYEKILMNIVLTLSYFGLSTYFTNGQTLGKKIMRIRVVSLVRERLTLIDSFEKALAYAASFVELEKAFLQYFYHPNHRTAEESSPVKLCKVDCDDHFPGKDFSRGFVVLGG